jgi:hypothetical protein
VRWLNAAPVLQPANAAGKIRRALAREQTSAGPSAATSQGEAIMAIRSSRTRAAGGVLAALALLAFMIVGADVHAKDPEAVKFKRVATQFIAALGDQAASSGTGAEAWGVWRVDPGPRGVRLESFERLQAAGGLAPAKWQFDTRNWWLEEHGLIMEPPDFPLPAGKYLVTGDRAVTTVLTIHPKDKAGTQRWELADGAKLYDVTHLPCRSARYTPASSDAVCSPAKALTRDFPVTPGAAMPAVAGCQKQDYAVLFVIGMAVTD